MKVKSESEVAQSCPTLSNPMDYSLPSSSIHGIFPGKSTGVGYHCLLRNGLDTPMKSHWVLFPAGTIEEAKEKKKKVPIVPETLKRKWKNFAEFKIKHLRKKLDPKML